MSETEQTTIERWTGRPVAALVTAIANALVAGAVGCMLVFLPALTEMIGLGMEIGLAAAAGLVGVSAGVALTSDGRGNEPSYTAPVPPVRHARMSTLPENEPALGTVELGQAQPTFCDRVRAERAAADPGLPPRR